MKCPKCGYNTVLDKFSKWRIFERTHRVTDRGKRFKVHALLNGRGEWFGYVIEELELEQEYYKTYKGNANHAFSSGTVSKTLREAKSKLKAWATK